MDILKTLEKEFALKADQAKNIVALIDEGNTIPFIARYRKEMTGSIDDQLLRELFDRLNYLRNLDAKREQVRKSILEQEKLTDEIDAQLNGAATLVEIEDIYRPFRPKRRTRASIAKEKGLENLANIIWAQETARPLEMEALPFIDEEKGVATAEEALEGAKDIVAEIISDDYNFRGMIRKEVWQKGFLATKAVDPENESVYEMYYDFQEPVKKVAGHRLLAANRGEKEKFLGVKIEVPEEDILAKLQKAIIKRNVHTERVMIETIEGV